MKASQGRLSQRLTHGITGATWQVWTKQCSQETQKKHGDTALHVEISKWPITTSKGQNLTQYLKGNAFFSIKPLLAKWVSSCFGAAYWRAQGGGPSQTIQVHKKTIPCTGAFRPTQGNWWEGFGHILKWVPHQYYKSQLALKFLSSIHGVEFWSCHSYNWKLQ